MKTALITGVSGAIGKATALEFLKNGYFVVGQFNQNEDAIAKFREELSNLNLGDMFFAVKCDFNSEQQVELLVEKVKEDFKHLDVLVLNAGVDLYKQIGDTENCEYDKVFNVNVKAPFILTKHFSKMMVERESGKILFVSSIWGEVGGSMESVYSASKSALIGFTKALAKELAPSVNVNCVCPGVIDTPMNDRFTKEEKKELEIKTPLKRMGNTNEIASLIYFLCSEKANFITGQIITADGGFTL